MEKDDNLLAALNYDALDTIAQRSWNSWLWELARNQVRPLYMDPVSCAISLSVFHNMFQQEPELDGRW